MANKTKSYYVFLFALFFIQGVYAQDEEDVDALIREGIVLHEDGKYAEAIKTYRKALDILPDSPIINAEIAMSYLYNGSNTEAIAYANKALSLRGGNFYGVYITKGSALRNMNRLSEAEAVFKQGLSATGDNYMLRYHLGQIYYLQNQNYEASQEFISAIKLQSNHANSHLLLAYAMLEMGKRNEALLGLMYFLMFESNTDRAEEAFMTIWSEFHSPKSIEEYLNQAVNFLRILSQNRDKIVETKILSQFWADYYMPFFDMIFREGYASVFTLHLASPFSNEAISALKSREESYQSFLNKIASFEEE